MLYGNQYIYGENKIEPSDIRYGIRDINVLGVSYVDDEVWVVGSNFTQYSRVFINDEEYTTEYYSDSLLKVKNYTLNANDEVYVVQRNGKTVLYETNKVIYSP